MKHKVSQLKNGLRVVTTPMKDSLTTTVSIVVGTGSRYEDFAVNGGVSHFLEHLLFKGTPRRPSAKVIAEEVDSVGGHHNAYTGQDITNYYVRVPAANLNMAIDLLSDMVMNPLLAPEEIDRERPVILEEMKVYQDDPARSIWHLIPPLMWPHDALRHEVLGSAKVIKNISREKILEYKEAHYIPSNMVVAVAGNISHGKVLKQVEKHMGAMKRKSRPTLPAAGERPAAKLVATHQKDTAQAHFVIAARAYAHLHPQDAAAKVMNNILGRGASSRLFMNVRERKGLAYSVGSSIQNLVDTGVFEVYVGASVDKVNQAIEAVVEELRQIVAAPVSAAELQKAKNQTRGGLLMAMESNSAIASRTGEQLILLGRIRTIKDTLKEIDKVKIEDVQRVAGELLAPAKLRMAIIAPKPEIAAKKFEQLIKS